MLLLSLCGCQSEEAKNVQTMIDAIGDVTADNCTNIRIGDSAYGTMFYVKAEYVAENYINEDGYRTLVLTNGVERIFDGYGDFYDHFWDNVGASYEDYIY